MLTSPFPYERTYTHPATSLPAPVCHIDAKGNIVDLSHAARRILEYGTEETVGPNFFSLVNRRNLAQVMRDIEDINRKCKSKASWLLRLWTGKERWRWYKATAYRYSDTSLPGITLNGDGGQEKGLIIHLQDVHDW